jgi:hypothetical protein
VRITATGFLDELKDKAEEFGDKAKEGFGSAKPEEVIENVKDRFDGGDETMGSEESVGYSSEGAEGIKEAVAATADSARSSFEDATAAAQDSADSIGGPPLITESAASSVEEALGAQEAAEDRRADSI